MGRNPSVLILASCSVAALVLAACKPNPAFTSVAPGSTSRTVGMSVSATPVPEGGQIDIKITLSAAPGTDVSIPYTVQGAATATSTAAGTACTSASDFSCDYSIASANPLVIPRGTTTGHIRIDVTDDPFEEEPDLESLTVQLGTPAGAVLGTTTTVTAFITDNDSDGLDGTISGRVVSAADGLPVSSVLVSGGGQTTTTNSAGHFSLVAPTPGAPLVVTFTKVGFVPQAKTTEQFIAADSATLLNIHMVPDTTSTPFDPAVGGTFAVPPTAAEVTILPNTLQKASDGSAPDAGTGAITLTPILPGVDTGTMPGIYRISDGPPAQGFEAFGGANVLVTDVNGNVLELMPLSAANLRIPVSTRNASPPSGAQVFGFSAATGLWTSESANTLAGTAPTQYYDSTITHLGTLAAGNASATVNVTGCVVDPTGSPVPDTTVVAEGIDYSGTTRAQTNADGQFTVAVKQNARAFLTANKRTGVSNAATVNTAVATTLTECLLMIPGAASIQLSWGATPLDLDSHLLGPNQSSHIYYPGAFRGDFSALPFAKLDVDDVDGFGPEITTIIKPAKSRSYSFWVRNYSEDFTPGMTGSPARVELYIKGEQSVFTPPPGESEDPNADTNISDSTTAWHVFDFSTDANCEIDPLSVTTPMAPWSHQSDTSINDPANNPNTDDLATFCN